MQPTLNLDDITSFEIGNKDYIKFKDENGEVKILNDNYNNRNSIEQFENKQSELYSLQSNNETKNTLEMTQETLKNEKEEVSSEINSLNANSENTIINQQLTLANDRILENKDEKIVYNRVDDQIVTTAINDNDVVIKEENVEEKEENTTSKLTYPPYDEVTVTLLLFKGQNNLDVNLFINQYLNDLTVRQIDLLMSNYILNSEQVTKLSEQKAVKEIVEKQVEEVKQIEKPKTFVLKKSDKAAFVDSLLLSFIVGLVWGMYLTFLIILILS